MNSLHTGAYVDLKDTKIKPGQTKEITPVTENLESDAVFTTIADYVKANPEEVKKVNAVFLYNILVEGTPKASWSKRSCSLL